MKRVHGAVVGLMAITLSGAAFAANYGSSAATSNPNAGASMSSNANATAATADLSNSFKATTLKGMSVENRQNQKLGSISDLIIDKDGKVSNVVLREGGLAGMGGHQYLVPWDRVQLTPGNKVAIIDVNKDQLSSEFSAMEENKGATTKEHNKKKKGKKPVVEEPAKPSSGTSGSSSAPAPAPSGGAGK